jgi:hypothetical protein
MFAFFYGLFVGAGAMRLIIWLTEGTLTIPWYGWVTGIIAFLFLSLALQTFFASFQERAPRAAWLSLLFMGVPALIFASITIMVI